ncbi:DUF2971 domain-containing protein [Dickeya zeae]|uniref:DUF2971 domain-containing protein n=1 Tax=Dickeya zeae TaxID=204042 RepID=UPI001CFA2835|nr:DUF2971 domain-containing protein [Dickeya zeae]UCZ76778.1 DUF2971 domain-containing protein [Dickeya zeae]
MSLYHYTDVNGLLGIIENKKIWATDIRFLNDSMEYYAGIESLSKICDGMVNHDHGGDHINKAFSDLYGILKKGIKDNLENRSLYVASFTDDRDNLRQWMSYCPPNGGYAIAFDRSKMVVSGGKDNKVVCRLEPVDYKDESMSNILSVDVITRDLKQNSLDIKNYSSKIVNDLLFRCCAIKNKEFYDEHETRLIIQSKTTKDHDVKFRSKSGVVVPYFEYCIEPEWITEIIIGPNVNMDLATSGMKELLDRNSIQCKIERSCCSLRVL